MPSGILCDSGYFPFPVISKAQADIQNPSMAKLRLVKMALGDLTRLFWLAKTVTITCSLGYSATDSDGSTDVGLLGLNQTLTPIGPMSPLTPSYDFGAYPLNAYPPWGPGQRNLFNGMIPSSGGGSFFPTMPLYFFDANSLGNHYGLFPRQTGTVVAYGVSAPYDFISNQALSIAFLSAIGFTIPAAGSYPNNGFSFVARDTTGFYAAPYVGATIEPRVAIPNAAVTTSQKYGATSGAMLTIKGTGTGLGTYTWPLYNAISGPHEYITSGGITFDFTEFWD